MNTANYFIPGEIYSLKESKMLNCNLGYFPRDISFFIAENYGNEYLFSTPNQKLLCLSIDYNTIVFYSIEENIILKTRNVQNYDYQESLKQIS